MTKGRLVFLTLGAGVITCATSPRLAPSVINGTSHRGKVEMGYHTQHRGPSHTVHPVFRVGVLLPGLGSSSIVDLKKDWFPLSMFTFKKSFQEVFISFPRYLLLTVQRYWLGS